MRIIPRFFALVLVLSVSGTRTRCGIFDYDYDYDYDYEYEYEYEYEYHFIEEEYEKALGAKVFTTRYAIPYRPRAFLQFPVLTATFRFRPVRRVAIETHPS
jgi:hypothetical protein